MNIIAVVGAGLIAALLSIILKQYKPEFGAYISLITGIIILMAVIKSVSPVLELIGDLTQTAALDSVYSAALLKSLAICYITGLAADTCKDSGETAIAAKVETAGKLAIVIVSLPLFKGIADIITGLIML